VDELRTIGEQKVNKKDEISKPYNPDYHEEFLQARQTTICRAVVLNKANTVEQIDWRPANERTTKLSTILLVDREKEHQCASPFSPKVYINQ